MNELIPQIAVILDEKSAQQIVALDVTSLTVITDCMLIANGRNVLHVKSLAEDLEDRLAEQGVHPLRKEGHQDGRWVVLDYGVVLVHLFHPEERDFYRLDKLWSQGCRVPLPCDEAEEP